MSNAGGQILKQVLHDKPQNEKGVKPEPLPQPPPRGPKNSTRPTPPSGGVAQGTASLD